MNFTISFDLEGSREFNAAMKAATEVGLELAPSMKVGADDVLIPKIQTNIRRNFNTTGDFPGRVRSQIESPSRADVIVWAIYAAVQEFGGTFRITPRQRAFFWAKWYETGDSMWRALALSASYTIPARPYVRPAVDSESIGTLERAAADLRERLASVI